MLAHRSPTIQPKQHSDHDLTELSWLTQSDIFDRSSSSKQTKGTAPVLSQTSPVYVTGKHRQNSSPSTSLFDSSDSEHEYDSSSLNSSSERVAANNDNVSPPHSALCFWILFAIEDSKPRALTLNQVCDWIERNIENSKTSNHQNSTPNGSDENSIQSARLKSKIRYHMTKQISFFVKITKDPRNGTKLRYPMWSTDRFKRQILLDTLITMTTRQLSLTSPHTIEIFERLCLERRKEFLRQNNDENSCPLEIQKRDKIIHRLTSSDETTNNKRKKRRSLLNGHDSSSSSLSSASVEVVDAAMTLLLLRQPK